MNDIQAPWVGMTPEEYKAWGNPFYTEHYDDEEEPDEESEEE